ncbi:hypothetical protein B4923_18030 [Brenneria roseae subsp. americana]|uniref:Uncharacterized protein n=2 Tax=Brenneria roseae TaxID=1509241 RepID=A0A2U1TKU1_9GAMM|nr:hypothetical protein B4923_18030 [Brenneria roseae subsp. americana]
MIELRNLASFMTDPEYLELMTWCLALHRRVLRVDRSGAYREMSKLFSNTIKSDESWLNMFQMTTRLPPSAAPRDKAFQLFQTIDGVGEGCFKPHLQIIYAFAYREAEGIWHDDVFEKDFGALVAGFPVTNKRPPSIFLKDPELNIPVNQWRNISAHKSFSLVAPKTILVIYGKGPRTKEQKIGLHRLSLVSSWLIKVHSAVRLANIITFVEHIREITSINQPNPERSLSSPLLGIAHGLSTVGFECIEWKVRSREGVLTVVDKINRDPIEALIHSSQQLVELSVGVLQDVATSSRVSKVSIQLKLPDGSLFGKARVSVNDADAFSLRKLSLNEYMECMEWILE